MKPNETYTKEHVEDEQYEEAGCPDNYTHPDYTPILDEDSAVNHRMRL